MKLQRWGGVAFALGSMWFASAACAQPSEDDARARVHFESGRAFFEEGAYDRALEAFQAGWDLSHRPPLLLNLASTNERLANYDAAIANIRQYLELVPDASDRAILERRAQNLERLRAGNVTPTSADTVPSTATPGGGGGGMDSMTLAAIVSYAVGGAGVLMVGIFGSLALASDSSLRSGCGATASCTPAQVADAGTFAAVSDVGLTIALVGAAAGTIFFVLGLSSGGSRPSSTALLPWLSPHAGGVSVHSAF